MRGHEYIYDLRKVHRLKPQCIFVNDFDCKREATDKRSQGAYPNVCIHGDYIPSIDFRFVTGCVVSACSDSRERAKALFERLKEFSPALLGVSFTPKQHEQARAWSGFWKKENDRA